MESDYERLMKKLPPEGTDHIAVYRRILELEINRHRSVKLVHELTGNEPDDEFEFLEFLGFQGAEPLAWNTGDHPHSSENSETTIRHGHTRAMQLLNESRPSIVICLNRPAYDDDRVIAVAQISVMLHEMGHVDDFEKGKFLRFDRVIDLFSAEEYAHRYACKRMMKENLRLPLNFYLNVLKGEAESEPVGTAQQESARRIVESGEYRHYRQFVGKFGLAE